MSEFTKILSRNLELFSQETGLVIMGQYNNAQAQNLYENFKDLNLNLGFHSLYATSFRYFKQLALSQNSPVHFCCQSSLDLATLELIRLYLYHCEVQLDDAELIHQLEASYPDYQIDEQRLFAGMQRLLEFQASQENPETNSDSDSCTPKSKTKKSSKASSQSLVPISLYKTALNLCLSLHLNPQDSHALVEIFEQASALDKLSQEQLTPEQLEIHQSFAKAKLGIFDLETEFVRQILATPLAQNIKKTLTNYPIKFPQEQKQIQLDLDLSELLKACQASAVLLVFPKSKDELLSLLLELNFGVSKYKEYLKHTNLEAYQQFCLNFKVFFLGNATSGIKTLNKLLEAKANEIDNCDRIRLYCSRNFLPSEHLAAKSRSVVYEYDYSLIANLKGVFSSDHIDPGSKLLISTYLDKSAPYNQHIYQAFNQALNRELALKQEQAQQNTQGLDSQASELAEQVLFKFLDYGCGAGVLSQNLAKIFGQATQGSQINLEFNLIDVYLPSLLSSSHNLSHCLTDLNRVDFKLYYQDALGLVDSELNQTRGFLEIFSNPPFHEGKNVTTDITAVLIKDASQRLAPQGALRIVANNMLPYEPLLRQSFAKVEIIAQNNQYTVYLASGAKK